MKHKAKDKCFTPIYARITHNRRSSYIALGITIDEDHWDQAGQRANLQHPNRVRMNATLGKIYNDIERVILEAIDDQKYFSSKELKEVILGKKTFTFSQYFRKDRDQHKKAQNLLQYKKANTIYNKLHTYSGKLDLNFKDITPEFLRNYEHHLSTYLGNGRNTIHTNLKYLRKLFNDAIREGIVKKGTSPFDTYKLTKAKTSRHYISEPELSALESIQFVNKTQEYHTLNMFILACYTGLRISDLLTLRLRNFDGNHINIHMRKTKDPLSIMVPTKGRAILMEYIEAKKDDEFIFPFLNSTVAYNNVSLQKAIMSKTASCNKYLKKLAEKAGISKTLSFHVSRHTFATRALRKGIRIEYVSKLLGHADLKTTQIYAKIVNKELDDAMEVFG
ncbi:site-specific integrase [bacterium]|nr:site-specific integrase [bacterium]